MSDPRQAKHGVADENGGASLRQMANAIRALAMDAVQKANSGHPGMPMGMADVVTVLYTRFLKIEPAAPQWPDRDRFILSAGHGSMLQYAVHHLLGFEDMPATELMNFRQLHARAAGHPEYGHAQGIEMTTGPLGQGISTAVGMALAERMLNAQFGDDLVDHRTWVIAGDGCLMEGISHEAIDLAGHLKLSRLIVLWDDNRISIDGATSLATSMDQAARFKAAGWNVLDCDGHNADGIAMAMEKAVHADRPTMIACRTIIGFGAPNKQGTEAVHGAPLGETEIEAARAQLGWNSEPFEIPDAIRAAWLAAGARSRNVRKAWEARLNASPQRVQFTQRIKPDLPPELFDAMGKFRDELIEKKPSIATRKASENVLAVINAATDRTLGGSADLTHSNLTFTNGLTAVTAENYAGRYIHYGIREHLMGAMMNGFALYGGFVPYGGTFMVFSDYARGAIRLSALMGLRVVYVLTHDSIGLGEDGPTHQPVEHLAMLRATPNLNVFRPADAVETAECWELALRNELGPTALCLSRQNLPAVRTAHGKENLCARGAYLLTPDDEPRSITLMATGSEIQVALEAAKLLGVKGISAAVVSMPCMELFEQQPESYRESVLGHAPRIAIEAAMRLGWDRWIGERGSFVGMDGFGLSAPAKVLYQHFRITAEAVVEKAELLLRKQIR